MSTWLTMKRVARYGFIGFIRNGFVSLAGVLVMAITLFVLANVLISDAAMQDTLRQLTDKVDVTVYFTTNATPDQMQALQQAVQALSEVKSATFVSADDALAAFKEKHQNDQLTMQALNELGSNPLGASLEIQAKDPSQYENIAKYLDAQQQSGTSGGAAIDKVNFYQNKTAIDRLSDIITRSRQNAFAKEMLLALCSILITFNTIRLAIYTSRDEIGVMSLVGASRWYVRGPFMVVGLLYGVVSALIVLVLLYPILLYRPVLIGLDPTSELLFGSFNSLTYYTQHILYFLGVLMGSAVLLGIVSSYMAVRRYLRM